VRQRGDDWSTASFARSDELDLLGRARHDRAKSDLATVVRTTWEWLAANEHRPLLALWAEAYTRSLTEPDANRFLGGGACGDRLR
jgi:hypothetical protein